MGQSILISVELMMTTVELTSSRLSLEMDTQPLAAILLLFLMEGSRLSSMLTMEMGLFRMSPMREFLSMPAVVKTAVVAHPVAHAVAHPVAIAHPIAHAVAHPVAHAVAHPVAIT